VGFIQRFTLYLGRPVVVFSTVLATLLIFSGFGSFFSKRFSATRMTAYVCIAAALVSLGMAFMAQLVIAYTLAWPTYLRVFVSMSLLAPAGFLMGMPFPMLIRSLKTSYPERIPWAFGINGFASVVGSIAAVILGMVAGYTMVLIFGVGCYLLTSMSVRSKLFS